MADTPPGTITTSDNTTIDSNNKDQQSPPEKRRKMENGATNDASSSDDNNNNNNNNDQKEETTSANVKQLPFDPDRPVPQLEGVTERDLQITIRVLQAVGSLHKKKKKKKNPQKKKRNQPSSSSSNDNDTNHGGEQQEEEEPKSGLELYQEANLRPLRKALAPCFELQKRIMFGGKSEDAHYEQIMAERSLKRQKQAERHQQKKYVAETALRRGRVERLRQLKEDAKEEELQKLMNVMVPDGHVHTTTTNSLLLENGIVVETVNDDDNANNNDNDQKQEQNNNGEQQEQIKLPKMRSCYVCKVRFRELHHFYDQMCPKCAPLNWEKRHQTADCSGMVAVVTGSRVKIGYQTCLKLLRAGATVVATTRFPNSAVSTYLQEDDFEAWKDRLEVYGLDLRDVTGLEAFTRFLKMRFPNGIDILINNACQTVRRPRGYYVPIMKKEQTLWETGGEDHKSILGGCTAFERVRRRLVVEHTAHPQGTPSSTTMHIEDDTKDGNNVPLLQMGMDFTSDNNEEESGATTNGENMAEVTDGRVNTSSKTSSQLAVSTSDDAHQTVPFETTGISHSAAMSQMVILPEDVGVADSILPPGVSDVNGQQLDLRQTNSWLLKMEEVSTPEIMECMFVNAIAPFVLNSRLKPLMTTPHTDDRRDRYVINVSAMEGKFYRYKMPNHPHTNMAKAALNMLTRTSAEDLAKKNRIYMNSVDTGWINDENPLEKASKIAKTNLFQTPIDEIDAAARILDPVFVGVNGGKEIKKDYGKFLKDYRESEW